MIRGSRSAPQRNEKDAQSDLLAKVEQELADMKRNLKEKETPPAYFMAMQSDFNETQMPMNDEKLSETFEYAQQVSSQGKNNQTLKEVVGRLAELEDNMPEFKGLNTWDVQVPLLKSTATLAEVISTVNRLIQRTSRQDRLK